MELKKRLELTSCRRRSETFQHIVKTLWTFAAQHAAEVHRKDAFGVPSCEFEFGQRILVRVKEPRTQFDAIFQAAVFLGYAPDATHGFFVMHPDGKLS